MKRKPKGTEYDFNIDEDAFVSIDKDNEVIECLLNLPELQRLLNPINMRNIHNHQRNDQHLMALHHRDPNQYRMEEFSGTEIITITNERHTNPKIVIPPSLLNDVVAWYHLTLGHPGTQCLYDTIRQ